MEYIAIFGVPRSGTSWLGQLFNSSPHVAYRFQPIFSYTFEGKIDENSSGDEILEFYRELLQTEDPFVCQKENISGQKMPQFSKDELTHLVWKEVRYLYLAEHILEKTPTRVIGIIRHPCAVIYSWFNAPREFDPDWDPKEEWRHAPHKNSGKEDYFGFEKWKAAAQLFLSLKNRYQDRFLLQKYEELNRDPLETVEKLFNLVGLSMNQQTEQFIQKSTQTKSKDPYGIFRKDKRSHEWVGRLDEQISDQILEDPGFREIDSKLGWEIPD